MIVIVMVLNLFFLVLWVDIDCLGDMYIVDIFKDLCWECGSDVDLFFIIGVDVLS